MANPFGPNALAMYLDDRLGFIQHVVESKPFACLIMDSPNTAQTLKQLSKDTLVIHRAFNANDPNWHDRKADGSWVFPPQQWLNDNAVNGVATAVFNEPSPGNIPKFIDWLIEVMEFASQTDRVLIVGRFAVGNPHDKDIAAGVYDRLILALANSKHYLGLHEYFRDDPIAEYPWLCGRFEFWLDRATVLGVKLKIVIDEHGRDLGGGANDGFHGQNWTDEDYFRILVAAQSIYKKYGIAVCIFCYGFGANNRWISFNYEHAETLKKLITQYGIDHPMTQTFYPKPDTLGPILNGVVATTRDSSGANVRQDPSVNSNVIGTVKVGDPITYRTKVFDNGGYSWIYSENKQGWIANVITITADTSIKILDVPYVSQLGNDGTLRNNDCGVASALMWTKFKLKKTGYGDIPLLRVNNLIPLSPLASDDNPLTIFELSTFLSSLGLNYTYSKQMTLAQIRSEIDKGNPPILLFNYKYLKAGNEFGHYAPVVGYSSTGFYIADPYLTGDRSFISSQNLEKALTDVSLFASIPYQGFSLS